MNLASLTPAAMITSALLFTAAPAVEAQSFDLRIGKPGGIGVRIGYDRHRHGGHRHGGYEIVRERVWVPGRYERVWHEPIYEIRYDPCGRARRVCVRAGYYETIQHRGHYEWRERRVYREHRRHGRRGYRR